MKRDGSRDADRYGSRFDPELWGRIHDGAEAGAATFVFRRGMELARDAALARAEPGARWLDAGSGGGHLAAALAGRACAVGLDHDPAMVRAARRRFVGCSPWPAFVVARAERLPVADASLDGVAAVSLLGCLRAAEPFLGETARALRPGGILVLTVTNRASVLRRLERVLRLRRPVKHDTTAERVRPYSRREIVRALACAGFAVDGVRGYGLHLELGGTMLPSAASSRALERYAGGAAGAVVARNLLVVARRR